ncbi:MAG: MopE-related protein, partial [Saprospiraceae bacterium]|nr:MopE-related protein [Saprospiraceae bacterium]
MSPFITAAASADLDAVFLSWLDPFNQPDKTYDLEILPATVPPSGNPTHSGIDGMSFTATGLVSGTLYHVYIRGDCGDAQSSWNGPVAVATRIDNNEPCGLALPIFDNSCPQLQEYEIAVGMINGASLGDDILLQQVEVVISHPWIADLTMLLVSPSGIEVLLSSDNGVGVQNMGDPADSTCQSPLVFSASACILVTELPGAFSGFAVPEESLGSFHDGTDPNGVWSLRICDKAADDIGQLRYIRLVFTENMCDVPPDPVVISELDTTATVLFQNDTLCTARQIVVSTDLNASPDTVSLLTTMDCTDTLYTITKLSPGTPYVVFTRRICADDTSQWSCPVYLETACYLLSQVTTFEQMPACGPSCSETCEITDPVWANVSTDDTDWIVYEGPTPTQFTGPGASRHHTGRYAYLETSGETCGDSSQAILQSGCLLIDSNPVGCDMSFWYHMYGSQVGALVVEISTDAGASWVPVWSASGNQGDSWQYAGIALGAFDSAFAMLRIVGIRGDGFLGDIAIDDIHLYGSSPVDSQAMLYFIDQDGDAFGTADSTICVCLPAPPPGFADNDADCDDQAESINPGAAERPCNLQDDNCNGEIDEGVNPDPVLYQVITITDATCTGIDDGSLEIEATSGSPPFAYHWNNQQDSNFIADLSPGVYQCTITDANGCVGITEFFVIDQTTVINYFVVDVDDPSCPGLADGMIDGAVLGGQGPYDYAWSNGDSILDISGLGNGAYQMTLTDANGCWLITEVIELDAEPTFDLVLVQEQDVRCYGGEDGTLQVISQGA